MLQPLSLIGRSFPLFLMSFKDGQLEIRDHKKQLYFLGDDNGPHFTIELEDPSVLHHILKDPDMNLGETYAEGKWNLAGSDLGQFLSWMVKNNAGRIRHMPGAGHTRNTPEASQKNVAHHYDLGNDLYAGFLDSGMNYSCAFFSDHRMSLHHAQLNKIHTSLERLRIEKHMRLLEIGCGWGDLCRIAAQSFPGIEVTGLTLSKRQVDWAREKNNAVKYGRSPEFILEDYRAHAQKNPEHYDRIVSIGMFEHVGKDYFGAYFEAIRRLLKPGGTALVHSIMRSHRGSGTSRWLDEYIFPGGCIPYLPDALRAAQKTGLALACPPYIHPGHHYAETLRRWRMNFNAAEKDLDPIRYDERFRRIWNFYLAISQASFTGFGNYVAQIVLRKP